MTEPEEEATLVCFVVNGYRRGRSRRSFEARVRELLLEAMWDEAHQIEHGLELTAVVATDPTQYAAAELPAPEPPALTASQGRAMLALQATPDGRSEQAGRYAALRGFAGQKYRRMFERLVELGLVEPYAHGGYALTQAGRDWRPK